MAKWEYFTVVTLSDAQLNRLGEEGWELVAIDMQNRKFFKRRGRDEKFEAFLRGGGVIKDLGASPT